MAKTKFEDMTIEELEKAKQDIGKQMRALRDVLHEAQLEWNSRQGEIKVRKIAEGLTDEEKESLRQVINPKGIATKEGVGKLGV